MVFGHAKRGEIQSKDDQLEKFPAAKFLSVGLLYCISLVWYLIRVSPKDPAHKRNRNEKLKERDADEETSSNLFDWDSLNFHTPICYLTLYLKKTGDSILTRREMEGFHSLVYGQKRAKIDVRGIWEADDFWERQMRCHAMQCVCLVKYAECIYVHVVLLTSSICSVLEPNLMGFSIWESEKEGNGMRNMQQPRSVNFSW